MVGSWKTSLSIFDLMVPFSKRHSYSCELRGGEKTCIYTGRLFFSSCTRWQLPAAKLLYNWGGLAEQLLKTCPIFPNKSNPYNPWDWKKKTYIYDTNQPNVGKYTIAPWMVWVMGACEVSYTSSPATRARHECLNFIPSCGKPETGRVGPKARNKRRCFRNIWPPIVINGWFFRDGWGIEPQMDFLQLPWYLVSCNTTCFTWRIIPPTDVSKWVS